MSLCCPTVFHELMKRDEAIWHALLPVGLQLGANGEIDGECRNCNCNSTLKRPAAPGTLVVCQVIILRQRHRPVFGTWADAMRFANDLLGNDVACEVVAL